MAKAADMKQIYGLSKNLGEFEVEYFGAFTTPGWASSEKGQRYFQELRKEHFLWVAVCDNEVIAYLSGRVNDSLSNDFLTGNLINLFINEDYRGMGIGGKLIDIFKDYCLQRDCKKIKVSFMNDNENAESVYNKKGFRPYTKTYICDIK